MNTSEEQFIADELDQQLQQRVDHETEQHMLTDILRRLADGVPISKSDVIALCAGCGIDKATVL